MIRLIRWLVLVLLVALSTPTWAATRYISPTGSNAADGTTTSTPWLTWAYAFTNTSCGDTLVVLDGTYTPSVTGNPTLTKACTVDTPYTIRGLNERVPLIAGTGAALSFSISASSYIILERLRFKSADLSSGSGGANNSVVELKNCTNCIVRLNIFSHNNRYFNSHLLTLRSTTGGTAQTHSILVEENEFYSFHRHAMFAYYSDGNIFRRNYCNSREYADITGGFPSGASTVGDDCIALYPSSNNVVENNIGESVLSVLDAESTSTSINNKFYGNIAYGDGTANNSILYGAKFRNRGATLTQQIRDFTLKDFVAVNPGHPTSGGGVGLYPRGALNFQAENITIINPSLNGIVTDVEPGNTGSGTFSFYCTNCLTTDGPTGIYVSGMTSWTVTNSNSYGNTTNYNPASSANYVPNPPSAVDPEMGSCYVWRPDGSAAKTNNWGADILYRYENGVLTTAALWNTVTGAFPHGAIITGVNDSAGDSAFDVHERLHVNFGGCSFPSGYGSSGPSNPAEWWSAEGTSSATKEITIPASTDYVIVDVALRETLGSVGSVDTVTSSCGGTESFSLITDGTTTATAVSSPAYFRVSSYIRANPTAGTCTITVTTTGTVERMVIIPHTADGYTGITNVSTTNGLGSTASGTVSTNTSETVFAFIAGRCNPVSGSCSTSISVPAIQTITVDAQHTAETTSLRGTASTQSGDDGGNSSFTFGASTYYAMVQYSMEPTTPDPPSSATVTQSKYRWMYPYGSETGAPFIRQIDTAMMVSTTATLRLRVELTGGGDTTSPFLAALYCRKNAGSYAKIADSFGSNAVRYYGETVDGTVISIPASLSATTQRLNTGNFVAGWMKRSADSVTIVQALAVGEHTELDAELVIQASAGDTIDCRWEKDDGTALDIYNVTPHLTIANPSAGGIGM